MAGIQLDYSDITDIVKEKLKVENVVKKISSVFLNNRYLNKIDYKPYYQRNYVWDDEKASYFIESILLGTEIPPIVWFQTHGKNEVIDGRQRFETIDRFINDKLVLNEKGMHSLSKLSGKKYSQLDEPIRELFEETRIRIIQFSVVDEPKLSEEKEDKIKKEIFRRYNSGITPLQKYDIYRAAYINDSVTEKLNETISNNNELYMFLCNIILPRSKKKANKRDKVNILVSTVRELITLQYIPIYSYSRAGAKADIIKKYYMKHIASDRTDDVNNTVSQFIEIVGYIQKVRQLCKVDILINNNLFYETLYWAFAIVRLYDCIVLTKDIKKIVKIITNANNDPGLWNSTINLPEPNIETLFETTGSHYYSAIDNRFCFISSVFSRVFDIDYQKHLKDKDSFVSIMNENSDLEDINRYKINKPLPETLTIEDIISDMKKCRFMIRPAYQRSEVKNIGKASYLMESIMLGMKIPPIFVYKREDRIKEVVDGQQRLLTIIGFLGKTYIDENGSVVASDKDRFKLSSLKILTELKGKNIDSIDPIFEEKILEFPIDVIEIDGTQNPEFKPIDLFLRLNTKPYPIKENTFEMWNAYVDKKIIFEVKSIATDYENIVFRAKESRMKLEELITSLAYLDYRLRKNDAVSEILNIYKRYNRMSARIKDKDTITKTLSTVSNESSEGFIESLENVRSFAEKVLCLTENSTRSIKSLFSHVRKTSSYKTDQNFYFLYLMIFDISAETISLYQDRIYQRISSIFNIIQNTPDDYNVSHFLSDVDSIKHLFD